MITDKFLQEMAKAMNNESFVIPAYQAYGTSDIAIINATDTQISGEIGDRTTLTGTRTLNQVDFSSIRSGADVVDTSNGDNIESSGIFATATQSTSDTLLQGIVINGVTHTTTFDIETITSLQFNRR